MLSSHARPVDSGAASLAHHGSAAFDTGRTLVLKGTVEGVALFQSALFAEARGHGCKRQGREWIAEGQAPNVIFPAGYRKDSFKPGDQVTVTVEPVKENQPLGRILESVLANGKTLGRASSAGAIP